MSRVLVTGGTGKLGRGFVSSRKEGWTVRIMSRKDRPSDLPDEIEWVKASLVSGKGLDAALDGVDALVHAATDPVKLTNQVDVSGTRRLLDKGCQVNLKHFIYPSIVGIDRIPFPYYRAKLTAERLIEKSGVPFSLLRITQFHDFVDNMLRAAARMPVMFIPTDFQFQSVDIADVASRIWQIISDGPQGRAPDFGGPEVNQLGDMAREWLQARHLLRRITNVPIPGDFAQGFRHGYNTTPNRESGKITWQEWLSRKL